MKYLISHEHLNYIKKENPFNSLAPIRDDEFLELIWRQSEWVKMESIDVRECYANFLSERVIGFIPQRQEPVFKDVIFRQLDKKKLKQVQQKLDL